MLDVDRAAPCLDTIPNQSPLAGVPDPVAPPTLLSLKEVKVMGLVEVPTALRVPSTEMLPEDLIDRPGGDAEGHSRMRP